MTATPTDGPDAHLAPGDPRLVFGLHGASTGEGADPVALANARGVLEAADIHVARTLMRLADETNSEAASIIAHLVAAARAGSSCLQLSPAQANVLRDSRLTDAKDNAAPIRLVDDLAYLDRYWRVERAVRDHVLARTTSALPVDTAAARASLQRHLPRPDQDQQRVAVAMALLRPLSVLAGGPGTGKTTTVAALVQVLSEVAATAPHVALAAPTGKAAARLQATLDRELGRTDLTRDLHAGTIHRLLKMRPGRPPAYSAPNPLPHEIVVVDEMSMVSLPLLAHLLAAVRDTARLVLVGDPDQLASVDVGAVLADLVHRPAPAAARPDPRLTSLLGDSRDPEPAGAPERPVVPESPIVPADAARAVTRLSRGWRFTGDIAILADAIRSGRVQRVEELLDAWQTTPQAWEPTAVSAGAGQTAASQVRFWQLADDAPARIGATGLPALAAAVSAQAAAILQAARDGDAQAALGALDAHQLLTAHRHGPYGAQRWSALMRAWASAAVPGYGRPVAGDPDGYLGAAIVVTRNDPDTGLFNGDVGVLITDSGAADGQLTAAFHAAGQATQRVRAGQLPEVLPVAAMTVHRAQGSQYDAVSVLLPPADSALLTRELLYTSVTRARHRVDIIGDRAAVLAAVANPARRASGLRRADAWEAARVELGS